MNILITCLLASGALCGIGYCWGWRDRGHTMFGVPKMDNPPAPPGRLPQSKLMPGYPPHRVSAIDDITAVQCEVCDHLIDCNNKWCFYPNNTFCQRRINKTAKTSKNLLN
jgi:hypothetical protein